VLSANCLLLVVSYKAFDREAVTSYTGLFARCGLVYFTIAMPAILIDHQNNLINRHYLDKRRPELYIVGNTDAIRDLRKLGERGLKSGTGPDLACLTNPRASGKAFKTKNLKKQILDDPFNFLNRAFFFVYKLEAQPPKAPPLFITIRFPQELAAALRFQL